MRRNPRRIEGEAASGLTAALGPRGWLCGVLPEFEYRAAQLQMAEAVEQAIALGETLLAEAGTGTGKTLAYLTPAILSGRKTLIATGTKTLQDQLFFKDIPLLASALPRKFVPSLMKGRGNYLCRRNLRRALEETHTRSQRQALLKIQAWSAKTARGDRAELAFLPEPDPLWDDIAAWSESCLGTSCEDYEDCFLTRMRQEAAAADVVIVNHHLLLADAVLRDRSQFQILPSYDVLVMDEAHLLEDVATDFFGVEISNLRVERLVRDTHREWVSARAAGAADPSIPSQLSRLAEASARFFQILDLPEGTRRLRPDTLEGICREAGQALIQDLVLLHDLVQAATGKPEGLLACARRAREQAGILAGLLDAPGEASEGGAGPAVVRWAERRGRGIFLRTSPLDVSEDFRRTILESAEAVILTSATLSAAGRFDFLRSRLGIHEAREFQAASPFDYARQAILYVPRHLPDPRSPGFVDAAAEEICGILEITRGRALVLFTSLEAMETTHRLMDGQRAVPAHGPGPGAPDGIAGQIPRGRGVGPLRHAKLLAGGGCRRRGALAASSSTSFPSDSRGIRSWRPAWSTSSSKGGDPFWEYQVPSAIITLRQGLGRLIRSGQDCGALCILDNRLLSRGYGRAFLESLPPCPVTSLREDVRRFFLREGAPTA